MYTWIDMYFFCCFTILFLSSLFWFCDFFSFPSPRRVLVEDFSSRVILRTVPFYHPHPVRRLLGWGVRRRRRKRDGYTHHGVLFCSSTNVDEKKKRRVSTNFPPDCIPSTQMDSLNSQLILTFSLSLSLRLILFDDFFFLLLLSFLPFDFSSKYFTSNGRMGQKPMVSMGGVEILLERHQCHDGRAKVLTARCKKKKKKIKTGRFESII